MAGRKFNFVVIFGWAAILAEAWFRNPYLFIVMTAVFMLGLACGAVIIGRIPRRVRTRREKIGRWIIGWPMFITNLALMGASCREMWLLNAPEWVAIFAFLWVLAYLCWKVFIYPDTDSGGWWRRGRAPEPPTPLPSPAGRPNPPIRDVGAVVVRGLAGRQEVPWLK